MSKKKVSTESYKGVRDLYPEDFAIQKYIFGIWRRFAEKCGYVEYHASILEPAELYRGKTSEEIVNEQTYTFVDRGKREVTLRPEMTPTVARMVAAKRRELPLPLRWYSIPNVFRYERPQHGRLREHWQLNVDLFGSENPAAEAEIIAMAYGLMFAFGATEKDFVIKVNSRRSLNECINRHTLSREKARGLLGLLDRKAKMREGDFKSELEKFGIPLEEIAPAEPPPDVADIIKPLHEAGLANIVYDPSVVRGFDYYNGIVFEVFDTHPDNNRSLFGGGRYDNLLDMFGEHVPAVGFGMGDVTITNFLSMRGLLPPHTSPIAVYIVVTSQDMVSEAMKLAGELRQRDINVAVDLGDKRIGDQIKSADKQKIPYIVAVGSREVQNNTFTIKELASGKETTVKREEIADAFLEQGEK